MRRPEFLLLAVAAVQITCCEASAFGTKAAHEALSDGAVSRAAQVVSVASYLRGQLGLHGAFGHRLAVQYGLDLEVDRDLITDASQTSFIETRLNRSLSWYDDDQNGFATRPFAPADVYELFGMNCRSAADFNQCYSELVRASIGKLIRIGTYAEDNPNPRSQHHFHDPERAHGISGHGLDNSSALSDSLGGTLAVEIATLARGGTWRRAFAAWLTYPGRPQTGGLGSFDLRGRSAIDRALNRPGFAGPASNDYPENRFALPDAERYLYRSLTSSETDERENYLALHFIAVGHVLHLLQDQASSPHTRNDFIRDHFLADRLRGDNSLETNGDVPDTVDDLIREIDGGDLLRSLPFAYLSSQSLAAPFYANTQAPVDAAGIDVAEFWDRGALDDPENDPTVAGLSERVHNGFFSEGSISNSAAASGYALPRVPSCALGASEGSGTTEVRTVSLPERALQTGKSLDTPRERFLSSPLVPHLARCRYHALRATMLGESDARSWSTTVRNSSVQRDYLELLFALAIDYGAKFLEHYLSPRIEVVPTGPGEFTLRNLTALAFTADSDAIEIAYTAADPTRPEGRRQRAEVSCNTGEIELPGKPVTGGSAPLGDFVCTLPATLPDPPLRADYWVVVRGQLGARGEAGTPSEFDAGIGPKDFVVAFDRVQPEILFQSQPGSQPGANDDAMNRVDLRAVPADLSRSIASPEDSPVIRDLGEYLRPALASRFGLDPEEVALLDFESPSAEPGRFRVAFSLDLAQAQGSVAYGHNDVWILDLSKDVEDPAALTVVPKSESALRGLGARWVAWNRDGITDDLAFSVDDPLDPVGGVLEWFGVDGGGGAPRESAFHPTSLHGPVMAAIEDVLGAGDLYLVALATGTGLFRFDLRSLSIHPFSEPPPPAIPNPPPAAIEEEAEFSPDGTKIAFIAGVLGDPRDEGGPLYVADLTRSSGVITGGSLRRVGTVARAVSPIWSPDGEWIVYYDNEVHDLFAIRATGGEDPIRLTHTGNMSAGNLTWLDPLPLPTTP